MYLRDDRFIGIYFETAASVLKFVKQSKGFISIMNTNSNVCQLLLGIVSKGGFIEKNDYFMAYIFSSVFSFNLFFSYGWFHVKSSRAWHTSQILFIFLKLSIHENL